VEERLEGTACAYYYESFRRNNQSVGTVNQCQAEVSFMMAAEEL